MMNIIFWVLIVTLLYRMELHDRANREILAWIKEHKKINQEKVFRMDRVESLVLTHVFPNLTEYDKALTIQAWREQDRVKEAT